MCGELEKFIHGATGGDLSAGFLQWVEALARIRVQDRSVVKKCWVGYGLFAAWRNCMFIAWRLEIP